MDLIRSHISHAASICASKGAGLLDDDLFRLLVLFDTTRRGVEGVEGDCNEEDELDGDSGKAGSRTEFVS